MAGGAGDAGDGRSFAESNARASAPGGGVTPGGNLRFNLAAQELGDAISQLAQYADVIQLDKGSDASSLGRDLRAARAAALSTQGRLRELHGLAGPPGAPAHAEYQRLKTLYLSVLEALSRTTQSALDRRAPPPKKALWRASDGGDPGALNAAAGGAVGYTELTENYASRAAAVGAPAAGAGAGAGAAPGFPGGGTAGLYVPPNLPPARRNPYLVRQPPAGAAAATPLLAGGRDDSRRTTTAAAEEGGAAPADGSYATAGPAGPGPTAAGAGGAGGNFAGGNFAGGNFAGGNFAGGGGGFAGSARLLDERKLQQLMSREWDEESLNIQRDISRINQLYKDVAWHVSSDARDFHRLQAQVESAADFSLRVAEELAAADLQLRSQRRWTLARYGAAAAAVTGGSFLIYRVLAAIV